MPPRDTAWRPYNRMAENIKYRQLKAFCLVVEAGSFKAAAGRLAVTQSTFSTLIKELEDDIGVALFERSTRRCVLTQGGKEFYGRIRSPMGHLEVAYRDMKEFAAGRRGVLHIAMLPSVSSGAVMDKLAEFQRMNPSVRVIIKDGKNAQVVEAVRNGEVELGIATLVEDDPELDFHELYEDRLAIVAPKGHPIAKDPPFWESLNKYDLIVITAGPSEYGLRHGNVQRLPAYEVEQAPTAVGLVRKGLGVTVIPLSVVSQMDTNGLEVAAVEGEYGRRVIGIVRRRNIPIGGTASAFIRCLTL